MNRAIEGLIGVQLLRSYGLIPFKEAQNPEVLAFLHDPKNIKNIDEAGLDLREKELLNDPSVEASEDAPPLIYGNHRSRFK